MMKNASNYLLTDTLPAELPIIFSNKQFYEYFNEHEEYLSDQRGVLSTIPVQFKVKKGESDFRILSLMNPLSELAIAKFINKYAKLILLYFQQNVVFSIRVYNGINDHYIEIKDKDKAEIRAMLDPQEWDEHGCLEEKVIRHYFNVVKFPKITDFYRSFYLKDLEIKYKYMLKLDIKSCFNNIYTHSVDWAYLGEKRLAKVNITNKERLSYELDKLMQCANYNETHGVLIGPEFSRMFAEIILTRIDRMVYEELKTEGLYFKKDYEIVRFVDDIFIFSSRKDDLDCIEGVLKEKLSMFKFALNESKRYVEKVPFLRKHLWVQKAKAIISELSKFCDNISNEPQKKSFYDNIWNEIRSVCVEYEAQMTYIISYFFSAFEKIQMIQIKNLNELISKGKEDLVDTDYSSSVCAHQARWIDLMAQSLSFSLSHSNVLKYSRMCIKFLQTYKDERYSIESIIFKKSYIILKHHQDAWTEMQNMVIALSFVKERLIPPDLFLSFLKRDSGYLSLATITFYIRKCDKNNLYYEEVYQKINDIIAKLIEKWVQFYKIDFDERKCIGETELKTFLCSEDLYIFHDFYSSGVLNVQNRSRFEKLKQQLRHEPQGNKVDLCYKEFLKYIRELDKPFMKWSISEPELIVDFFLEKHLKNFQYD